jgi:hypothetical protein
MDSDNFRDGWVELVGGLLSERTAHISRRNTTLRFVLDDENQHSASHTPFVFVSIVSLSRQ